MKKIFIIACIILLVFLSGCNTSEQKVSSSTDTNSVSENGGISLAEDELIELIFPKNLLGGGTAEKAENSFLTLVDPDPKETFSDVKSNEDGSLSVFVTQSQLEKFKTNIYSYGHYNKRYSNTSITNVEYKDDLLHEILVHVTRTEYLNSNVNAIMDRTMANTGLAMYAGMYQLACGTPPDEWHTTITVKDEETGEIISVNDFPNDDMYRAY